jgi:hypothetical protein
MFINIYIYVCVCKYINFSTKILKKAGKLSTGGFLKKTASGNAISTGGSIITASGNGDFHWPLALAALKNASENSFRTVTIELLCTSVHYRVTALLQTNNSSSFICRMPSGM